MEHMFDAVFKDQIEVMETDENTLNIKTDEDYIKNLHVIVLF